jgi:hypothetical protein
MLPFPRAYHTCYEAARVVKILGAAAPFYRSTTLGSKWYSVIPRIINDQEGRLWTESVKSLGTEVAVRWRSLEDTGHLTFQY